MAKSKQLPAGKSKAAKVKAAAKRATAKKASKKKSSPAGPKAPTAPESAKAPVSSPTGSLVSPETWAADQARLQSAAEDADTVDELNQEEASADSDYTSRVSEAKTLAAKRKLDLAKQKSEFDKTKSDDYKSAGNAFAYRGASRSSAASRGVRDIATQHSRVDNEFTGETVAADNFVKDTEANAATLRGERKAYVTKRRGTLAHRAASRGVYSDGAANGEAGVSAPTFAPGAAAAAKAKKAKAAPTFKGKYQGPDKYKGDKKKIAAAKAAAAKRRVAKKGMK